MFHTSIICNFYYSISLKFVHFIFSTCKWNEHNQHYLSMKYTLVKFTSAPEYMSCYKWLPILVFKNKICYMHYYKTLEWWIIFRCQYTFTSNNQLRGCLNPPCLVLFSAVDVVAKHSSVIKTKVNAGSAIAKSIRVVGRDIKFANNFITSW